MKGKPDTRENVYLQGALGAIHTQQPVARAKVTHGVAGPVTGGVVGHVTPGIG